MTELNYHAAYYQEPEDEGWFVVEVVDFPGAISQGRTLKSARRMIRDALRGLAECKLELGQPLPQPDPKAKAKAKGAKFFENVPLRIRATCDLAQ
jgi:predicted RNase H-like HicB family nuclease